MITLTILAIGLVTAVLAGYRSMRQHGSMPIIDPDRETTWIVGALQARLRLAALVSRRLDPTMTGGLLLTIAVTTVFGLSLFAGWVFDSLDETTGFARFDNLVAEWGAANASDTSTTVLTMVTDLGGTLVISIVTLAVAAWGWFRYRNPHVAFFMIAVSLSQTLVNNGLKWIIDRERPDFAQLAGWAGSSFPSGHTAAAAATYAGVALVLGLAASTATRAALAAGAVSIAAAVGATRALLGVHWLTDVLAGLAVGWACFIACAIAFGGRLMVFGEPVHAAAQVSERELTTPAAGRDQP